MKKTHSDRNEVIAKGLAHGRELCRLLREGTDEKCARMLNELQEAASFHEADNLTRSLATCADVSLGSHAAYSESIRKAAGEFRDVIVACPPKNRRGWKEINEALAPPAATSQTDDPPPTVRTHTVGHVLPKQTTDVDHIDDESIRYRYLDEKDGS